MAAIEMRQRDEVVTLKLPENPVKLPWNAAREVGTVLREQARAALRWESDTHYKGEVRYKVDGAYVWLLIPEGDEAVIPAVAALQVAAKILDAARQAEDYARANEIVFDNAILYNLGLPLSLLTHNREVGREIERTARRLRGVRPAGQPRPRMERN